MIKQYWDKYKDVILYLVFGVFTTVVNIVSYWLCAHVLGLGVMASSVIAWALAEANPVYPVPVVYDAKRCEKVIRRIIAEA